MKSNPIAFYRLINKQGSALVTGIPLQEWFHHGKKLYYSEDDIHKLQTPLFPYQDRHIFTPADVFEAIRKMKNNKAADKFDIKAEYFKELKDTEFPNSMTTVFNDVVRTDIFPRTWSEAEARPLHKSGSLLNKDNFRYIMITSMFYKLYSTAINDKITPFMQNDSQKFQAGFRKGHSCAHHLFTLRVLVEKARAEQQSLFVCFVDLRKAFDSVPRSLLWKQYEKTGIPSDFIRAVQLMYQHVYVAIRTADGLTEWFMSNLGVRQGCSHSPTAFAIYMQPLHDYLKENKDSIDAPVLLILIILLLLFADDIALTSLSGKGLQTQLEVLDDFCMDTHMTVNTDKTVIVVFNPLKKHKIPTFFWRGKELKIEESATYLGMMTFSTKCFHEAEQAKITAAINASYMILSKAINAHLLRPVPIREYFTHNVLPKLLYAAPIWAVGCSKDGWLQVEQVQTDYYKAHFALPTSTNGLALLTELGICPIQVQAMIATVQFVQELHEIPADRIPNLALQHSKTMTTGWWSQLTTWLHSWHLQESRIYKYTANQIRRQAMRKLWGPQQKFSRKKDLYQKYVNRQPGNLKLQKYLESQNGFGYTKALLAIRVGATYWTLQHIYKYAETNREPPCHLCHNPVDHLEDHLMFHCHSMEQFRISHPFLQTHFKTFTEVINASPQDTMPHTYVYFQYVKNLKPADVELNTDQVQTLSSITKDLTSSDTDSEDIDDRRDDKSFRSSISSSSPALTSHRVLRSQAAK